MVPFAVLKQTNKQTDFYLTATYIDSAFDGSQDIGVKSQNEIMCIFKTSVTADVLWGN